MGSSERRHRAAEPFDGRRHTGLGLDTAERNVSASDPWTGRVARDLRGGLPTGAALTVGLGAELVHRTALTVGLGAELVHRTGLSGLPQSTKRTVLPGAEVGSGSREPAEGEPVAVRGETGNRKSSIGARAISRFRPRGA